MVDLKLSFPDSFFEEEVRSGFTVTRERKELWAVELDLLNEFDKVCRKYDLKYYADGGTALGAVRHNGFIPWDDDIDLAMFRSDYNRLCEIAPAEFIRPYFFQTEYTDPGSMRGHAQLRNSETTAILMTEKEAHLPFDQGIFIDIFPLDEVPDAERSFKRFIRRLRRKRKLAVIYARLTSRYRREPVSLREIAIRALHAVLPGEKNCFYNSFEKFAQSRNGCGSNRIGMVTLYDIPDNYIFDVSWYRETVCLPFEMISVPVCGDYDAYLTRLYDDWKIQVQAPNLHGDVLIDTDRPFTDYL